MQFTRDAERDADRHRVAVRAGQLVTTAGAHDVSVANAQRSHSHDLHSGVSDLRILAHGVGAGHRTLRVAGLPDAAPN
jgi:hypothetical protein